MLKYFKEKLYFLKDVSIIRVRLTKITVDK